MKPNLAKPMRALYVVFGVALAVSPMLFSLGGWLKVAMPVLGIMSVLGGLSGR